MIAARHCAIVVALACCAKGACAQLMPGVTILPGAEVRVTLALSRDGVRGVFISADSDSLRIRPRNAAARSAFHFADVHRLHLRGGEDKRRGFLIGGAVLGGIGIVFGGVDYARNAISGGDYFGTVVANFLIGGLVGYVFAPRGWIELPLHR